MYEIYIKLLLLYLLHIMGKCKKKLNYPRNYDVVLELRENIFNRISV